MSTAFEQLRKILVPVDLSERSEAALTYGAMLARLSGAELVVMVNVNLPERELLEEVCLDQGVSLDAAADLTLRALVDRLARGVPVRLIVAEADYPADGILAMAEQHDVDMIVIASHGRGGVRRWLLGSVADKVARGADHPVTIVPARDV